MDMHRVWTHEVASTDYEHCILDWTKIGTSGETASGWHSSAHWFCDDCHDQHMSVTASNFAAEENCTHSGHCLPKRSE